MKGITMNDRDMNQDLLDASGYIDEAELEEIAVPDVAGGTTWVSTVTTTTVTTTLGTPPVPTNACTSECRWPW
jgi:hypothetical protein